MTDANINLLSYESCKYAQRFLHTLQKFLFHSKSMEDNNKLSLFSITATKQISQLFTNVYCLQVHVFWFLHYVTEISLCWVVCKWLMHNGIMWRSYILAQLLLLGELIISSCIYSFWVCPCHRLNNTHHSHVFTRLKIYYHVYSIVQMPHIQHSNPSTVVHRIDDCCINLV